jgi:4-alpha-glucanotransferase
VTNALNVRSAGLLLHPSSLPGPEVQGTLGRAAYELVDWMHGQHLQFWQLLPLHPPGKGHSPYSARSSFMGNPWLIDLTILANDGLLTQHELNDALNNSQAPKDAKLVALKQAAQRLLNQPNHRTHKQLEAFLKKSSWIRDAARFETFSRVFSDQPWQKWPAPLRRRDVHALNEADRQYAQSLRHWEVIAFFFDTQWMALRQYAEQRGVLFVGDMPIYMALQSADVWVHQHLFELDEAGEPIRIAGVPPDAFSETGQLWENPLYRWEAIAQDDYRFWHARVQRALELTQWVRLDHFRGFSAYYAIDATATDATTGEWEKGPGLALFESLSHHLGPLPLIAEDLGLIDDEVVALRNKVGLPGMHVMQFAFDDNDDNPHLPKHHQSHAVVYPGTHDNDTLVGWTAGLSEQETHRVEKTLAVRDKSLVDAILNAVYHSAAKLAIIPAQDLLKLSSQARMNRPGEAEGNWEWRLDPDEFERLKALNLNAVLASSRRLVDR